MKILFVLVLLAGCDSKQAKEKSHDLEDMKEEASVDWARKQLPELEADLASSDPGKASSACSVIKPDMKAIAKADPKLAETITLRCGHDLALRSLVVFVERAEAARTAAPDDKFLTECSGWSIYMKPVTAAGADGDPQIAALKDRFGKACPGKP
jgi:hypothetical protein